ncbi:hypothetical protein G9F32_13375 [Acinetobacter sp. 194]|uniref:T6SS immunity protein Tli4 family protein n=1 Tax=Acinetobacter shaoyimingii TaxID=2715164 RepID=UPI00140BB23F|nr:T6SS immunity protein Tli4 family protein [Acinetobacter shaoyimingii]NHB59001.1 hypothetical protein [Acinetobacter shaoyimingii]
MYKAKLWQVAFLVMLNVGCTQNNTSTEKTIDFTQTNQVCLGRIELTVPKETDIQFGQFSFDGNQFEIDSTITNLIHYETYIAERIEEISEQKHESTDSLLKLHKIIVLDHNHSSHVIAYRPTPFSYDAFLIEAYLYLNHKTIKLVNLTDDAHFEETLSKVENTLKNFKLFSAKQPNEAGICWQEYFLSDPMTENRPFLTEAILKFPSYPELKFNVENRGRFESDQSLIKTIQDNKARLPLNPLIYNEKVLREIEKEINQLKGEEVITHYKLRLLFSRGFETGAWQYLGSINDPKDSYIYFGLESADKYRNKSLNSPTNPSKVLELYDFILNSIHVAKHNQFK